MLSASFLIGLTGSFAHCAGMCYPFVLFISTKFGKQAAGYSLIIPHIKYNLGRITTYTALGAIAGWAGDFVLLSRWWALRSVFSILFGLALILFAIRIPLHIPNFLNISKFPTFNSAYLTGMLLGFLPCGLVISGLISACTAKDAYRGALSMLLFGFGTSAALLTMALFGGVITRYLPLAKKLFSVVLFLSGAYLIYTGLTL